MLLSNVGVNFLVVTAGIFFLPFSKWYVVSDTANSSVRLRIIFSYLERDTHWSGRDATRPIKLDMPGANVLSASFTASAGFQVGSAAMQNPASRMMARTRKIFISRDMRSAALIEGEFFCALSLHIDDYFPASVPFFEIRKRVFYLAKRLVSPVDDGSNFS
jgi:hypothetical protein